MRKMIETRDVKTQQVSVTMLGHLDLYRWAYVLLGHALRHWKKSKSGKNAFFKPSRPVEL